MKKRFHLTSSMGIFVWLLCFLLVLSQSYCVRVVAGANGSSTADEWTMFRRDLNHSGYTTGDFSGGSVELLWKYGTKQMVISSPAVVNGCVFVGSWDESFYCLNASSGDLVWTYPFEKETRSSPAIYNNRVYVGTEGGKVYCLDSATGTFVWKQSIGGFVRSSPAVVDDRVYIGSGEHDVFCLNASDGAVMWRYPTSARVFSSPAVSDGVVYVAVEDYSVYALNASTGEKMWSTHTGSTVSSPCIHNGYLYIGSVDGEVFCLNAFTGATVWGYKTKSSVSSSPTVAYGCVYVGSEDTSMYCFNASNGEKIWQSPTGYWVYSSPAVADGNVYVGSEDYNLYCFDAFTGAKKWSYETNNFVDSSPTIVDGKLFVGSSDWHVYAFSLGDSVDELPSQSTNSVHLGTIIFDALACIVFGMVIFYGARFVRSAWQTEQDEVSKSGDQKFGWFSRHPNAVYLLAILAFSATFLIDLDAGPIWVSDEKFYSQYTFHMVKSGDYLTPWAFGNQAMGIAKPPLFMWLMSISYQIFGVTNFSTRLWNPMFGTLSLIISFYLGKELYNRHVGFLSALVLGTFVTFHNFSSHAMLDVPLIFFMMVSIYCFVLSEKRDNADKYLALGGLFFGLAFMTKLIAALLVPLIMFAYLFATGKGVRFLFTKRFKRFWKTSFLIVFPWILFMFLWFGPSFIYYFFIHSGFNRIITAVEGHVGNYLYYFVFLANKETLPWVILLPFAVGLCVFKSTIKRSKEDMLVLMWITIVLGVFTVSQTKIEWYILPAFPAFALAISSFLYQLTQKILHKKPLQQNENNTLST